MSFIHFKIAVQEQFKYMTDNCEHLFVVDVDKDELWDLYLDSFPPGTNNIFRERREYDCQCCKQFIRTIGAVVGIIDGKLVSIWDCNPGGYYVPVVKALKDHVESKSIKEPFLHYEPYVGTDSNTQYLDDGGSLEWEHFFVKLPNRFVVPGHTISSSLGKFRSNKAVFGRGMHEISLESAEIVVELIEQNSLYRGEEHLKAVQDFIKTKKTLIKNYDMNNHDLFFWEESMRQGPGIKNTVIGTLLMDLSEGKDLEYAVKSFETKVAPENYKRPTALITKSMIKNAEKKVQELGLEDSLPRRYAVPEDITINNVLFASRSAKKAMNVFDELSEEVGDKLPNLDKVEEVSIDTFISDILPKCKNIEALFENSHVSNLVSVISPVYDDAPLMFKWPNQFSWCYNGDVADSSLRKQVKDLGGRVDGVIRFSHTWNYDGCNQSLMDLHVFLPTSSYNHKELREEIHDNYPSGQRVGWNNRKDVRSGGVQDVDYTQPPGDKVPVENISFPSLDRLPEGDYYFKLHNWQFRPTTTSGAKAEIEIDGVVYSYEITRPLKNKEWITLAKVTLKDGEFTIEHLCDHSASQKEEYGILTNKFHPVSMVMNSPNHWDGNETGNKHYFFILDKCKKEGEARGFYNEFLRNDLNEHRKVFEVLGSKMKAEESDKQLSGLGFSTTQRNHVYLKVSGSFTRTIKVVF